MTEPAEPLERNASVSVSCWQRKIIELSEWDDDRLQCALIMGEISLLDWINAYALRHNLQGLFYAAGKLEARLKRSSRAHAP